MKKWKHGNWQNGSSQQKRRKSKKLQKQAINKFICIFGCEVGVQEFEDNLMDAGTLCSSHQLSSTCSQNQKLHMESSRHRLVETQTLLLPHVEELGKLGG